MLVDLIIGIDIGTTGTGVAWGQPDAREVKFLRWDEALDIVKTPTRVFYRGGGLVGWGLQAPDYHSTDVSVKEWFKADLGQGSQPADDTRKSYIDFMTCLYHELSRRHAPAMLGKTPWKDARIHFLFSVPATWDARTVEDFRGFALSAGFGQLPGHSMDIGLTEPQAVAAFQLCDKDNTTRLKPGQVVLVVDAGGGTGDFCLLEIQQNQHGHLHAIGLKPASGDAIGSIYIDEGFELKAKEALERLQPDPSNVAGYLAWKMRRSSNFQEAKHKFGLRQPPTYKFPVVAYSDNSEGPLQNESFSFDRLDMQELFDTQVELLHKGIITSSSWLKVHRQPEDSHIDYILLSGGLGTSAYVEKELKRRCVDVNHQGSREPEVVACVDPRLSVCRGMVYSALRGPSLFPRFPCRAAFGVVCGVPDSGRVESRWKPVLKRAKKEAVNKDTDSVTGKELFWCIDWFLQKGTMIDNGQTIDHEHYAYFAEDTPVEERIVQVKMMTSKEDNPSPFERGQAGPQMLGSMRVRLSEVEECSIERRRGLGRHFYKVEYWRKPPIKVKFLIEARIGLAQANFRCFNPSKTKPLSEPINFKVHQDGNTDLVPFSTGLDHTEE